MTREQVEYLNGLIGRQWQSTGLHCWELTRVVQRDLFGRVLPPVDEAPATFRETVAAIESHPERARWQRIDAPVHGAVVLMSRGQAGAGRDAHIGTYLDLDGGGVLHASQSYGVAFDPITLLTVAGWRGLTFYTLKD